MEALISSETLLPIFRLWNVLSCASLLRIVSRMPSGPLHPTSNSVPLETQQIICAAHIGVKTVLRPERANVSIYKETA
jgi:hypothetical protein